MVVGIGTPFRDWFGNLLRDCNGFHQLSGTYAVPGLGRIKLSNSMKGPRTAEVRLAREKLTLPWQGSGHPRGPAATLVRTTSVPSVPATSVSRRASSDRVSRPGPPNPDRRRMDSRAEVGSPSPHRPVRERGGVPMVAHRAELGQGLSIDRR